MEWLTKLFDIGKLPSKILAWVCLLSGFLLFGSPNSLLKLHLEKIPTEYGFQIGLAFIGSASLLAINSSLWGFSKIRSHYLGRRWKRLLRELLSKLDRQEKAILREFYLQGRDTIKMPLDNATISGLLNKGVLRAVSRLGESSMVGMLFPLAIAAEAKELLTPQLLDISGGQPSEEERQFIIQSRPAFVKQLETIDWLKDGLF